MPYNTCNFLNNNSYHNIIFELKQIGHSIRVAWLRKVLNCKKRATLHVRAQIFHRWYHTYPDEKRRKSIHTIEVDTKIYTQSLGHPIE